MSADSVSAVYMLQKAYAAALPALCSLFAARGLLHYFQLESYQFPGYFRTLRRNALHAFLPGLLSALASLILFFVLSAATLEETPRWARVCALAALPPLACLMGYGIARSLREQKAKKPFVFTGRIKRLYGTLCLVMLLIAWAIAQTPFVMANALWPVLLPLVIALAGLCAWPLEKGISELYFRSARRKLLSNPGLIRIGITGSYGKTSVKHILGAILSEKYPTLITPASFNTPMGVTRAIREKLHPSYQVFIGEMGARHVGDIREMCRLVRPTIGIVTSVGPQHLETFKTIERVAQTKYELIEALPGEGSHCYFYDDGAYCLQMYQKTQKPKTLCGANPETADVWARDVRVSREGSAFTLHIRTLGSVECHTRLLGEHAIHNILLAAAVAADLRMTLKQIAHGISQLQPVKHRLELLSHPGGFTIINDAFNSNPVGAKAALDVLASFPKRRIIITPGMVELGAREADYNREFGRQMASRVDVAIIVGKRRAVPIIEGLTQAGFDQSAIHRVDSLDQSTQVLHAIVTPSDTVLYENDLPDHYQEA